MHFTTFPNMALPFQSKAYSYIYLQDKHEYAVTIQCTNVPMPSVNALFV